MPHAALSLIFRLAIDRAHNDASRPQSHYVARGWEDERMQLFFFFSPQLYTFLAGLFQVAGIHICSRNQCSHFELHSYLQENQLSDIYRLEDFLIMS